MGIYVNPGNTAFRKALNSDIYIDKTDLITYTNSRIDKTDCFICVSRPRRFGKSMAADMICVYRVLDRIMHLQREKCIVEF